jgi:prolyl-tRNA synthetase
MQQLFVCFCDIVCLAVYNVQTMLALPTIKGAKSPSERFAGADDTYTIEAMMQNGWALQSGTSHFLGQNFARAFDVHYQNASERRELVWATSWGVSTRLIGEFLVILSAERVCSVCVHRVWTR